MQFLKSTASRISGVCCRSLQKQLLLVCDLAAQAESAQFFFAPIWVVFWIFQVKTVVNIAWASLQDDVLGLGFGSVFSPSPFSRRCFRTPTFFFSLCTCQIVGDLTSPLGVCTRLVHKKNPLEQSELNQGSSKLSWVPNLGLSLFGACGFFLGSWCIRIYHFMDPSSFPASCDWAFATCPAFEKIIRSEGPSPFATASLEIYINISISRSDNDVWRLSLNYYVWICVFQCLRLNT